MTSLSLSSFSSKQLARLQFFSKHFGEVEKLIRLKNPFFIRMKRRRLTLDNLKLLKLIYLTLNFINKLYLLKLIFIYVK